MDSTKVPRRRSPSKHIERIFGRLLIVELRKKIRWIIGGALLLAALTAIFLMTKT